MRMGRAATAAISIALTSITPGVRPAAASATSPVLGCHAVALAQGSTKVGVANPATVPCINDTVRVVAANGAAGEAKTWRTDSFDGEGAAALATVTNLVIILPGHTITVNEAYAWAGASAISPPDSFSWVGGVLIDSEVVTPLSDPVDIGISGVGVLHLNATVYSDGAGSGSIVNRRAVWLETPAGYTIAAQATAGLY